jgi:hypothetical protein
MTGIDVPRGVRVAALLTLVMVPVGLLLVVDGALELLWWASADAHRLRALMAQLQTTYGLTPPALLRGRSGAVELVVLGVAATAFGLLGLGVWRGRSWARTAALAFGGVTALVGIVLVGSDATESRPPASYFTLLADSATPQYIAPLKALFYPAWYAWAEDLLQGAQVLGTVAALIALIAAVIAHGDFFLGRPAGGQPDEWDAALSRIRQQTRPDPE